MTPVGKAKGALSHAIRQNNGIREANILRLFLPLGFQPADLDTKLLADLDSFGADRGKVAHSASVHVTQQLDPKAEAERVDQLLIDLKAFDSLIASRLQSVTS